MQHITASIRELTALSGSQGQAWTAAWIQCPENAVPAPGRYMLGILEEDRQEPLANVLFAAGYGPEGFLAAPPIPAGWLPGMAISLHGPFGHGFNLPENMRRLALAGKDAPLRLLPLVRLGLAAGMDVAMFCDTPPGGLPSSVEVMPLSGLAEGVSWADFLAIEVVRTAVKGLADWMGRMPLCPAEVLVTGPMPCGGLAGCGVCTLDGRRGALLACESGPVFPLDRLWRAEML